MSRADELTVEQIEKLAAAVTRSKQLHPGFRGEGDPIVMPWLATRDVGPSVGRQIDVYHVTIAVRVPADEAGRLPGFPGDAWVTDDDQVDIDSPVSGIDLLLGEAQHAAQDAVERVLFSALASGAVVGPGPNGGVVRVSVTYETPADRSF